MLASVPLQILSHYPALPPPISLELLESNSHTCSYLPDRLARVRAFSADQMSGELYHKFMDAGFRRSGDLFYQPICAGCRQCIPIRVPIETFKPSPSQRRCVGRNSDLSISVAPPRISEEKFAIYAKYMTQWHGKSDATFDELESFLYTSPVDSLEFEYRDKSSRLLAVGICDVCPQALSSVYFYFDPAARRRGLGTLGVLREIEFAREHSITHYYLGYWVPDCTSMNYKAKFRPCEILCGDGLWRNLAEIAR